MSRDKRERERQENWSENLTEDHSEDCSVKILFWKECISVPMIMFLRGKTFSLAPITEKN